MKTEVTNEKGEFNLSFSGIKNVEDIKEAIHQCRLVESQIADGKLNNHVSDSGHIAHGKIEILNGDRYGAILVPTGVWLFESTLKKTDQCDRT